MREMFVWLKHYMPRGIYGRAALILVLPVITLQLLVSVVFIQRHFEGVTRLMTAGVVLELRHIWTLAEAALDPVAARAVVAAVADPLELTVTWPPDASDLGNTRLFYDLSGRTVIAVLTEQLPPLRAVHLADENRVDLWVDTRHGLMQVAFSRSRVSASNPHQLLVIMIVMGAVMTLVSYFFLRNQLRPIKRMARAAVEYGKGRIVPYHPSGAVEVRAAGAAFLDMRARIERQNQSRTMMLSGVSHDLRTPLTRLRLGLSMMDDVEAAPLVRDVDDMQRLLDAFLDFARSEAADEVVPTDPVALLAGLVEDFARSGVTIEALPPEGVALLVGPVQLRPMAIRRALDNLVGNALRYGSCAVVSLTVSERTLRFTVEDDGPGIPADRRDEAIRPFTRLDPARNQNKGPGVGLGLAIVADIARLHGGTLRLSDSDTYGGLRADLVLAR